MLTEFLSNILTLIGIISAVSGFLGALLIMWLRTKFVSKTAYYADKDKLEVRLEAFDDRIAKIEQAQEIAKGPIAGMKESFDGMKAELVLLTAAVHAIDTRTSVLQASADARRRR